VTVQAKAAFEAYKQGIGAAGVLATWDQLPERVQEAWRAAVVAAVDAPSRSENLTDKQVRLLHETHTAKVARQLKELLPPGQGFVLITFDFGPGGNLAYVSNGDRNDVIRALREWLHRQGAL
jgi:hypothetical protein